MRLAPADEGRLSRLAALLLFLGVLVVFWPLSRADYLNYDDPVFIQLNRRLDAGFTWENVDWALTANLTHFSPSLEYWSPLTALSRLSDVALWGKDPHGHHSVSLVLHGLSAVLLFSALRRLTGRVGVAVWVAAVFAFHPALVEPVAWLSARKDVIYGLTWNLTLLAYAAYARPASDGGKSPSSRRRYFLLLGAFLLAAMSKPMVLTLPCVLLLLDLWPLARIAAPGTAGFWRGLRRPLLEKLPMFGISLGLAWLAMYSQRGWNAVVPDAVLPLPARLANAVYAYWEYLRLVFWPAGLSPFHPFVAVIPGWQVGLALAGLLGITALVLWQLGSRPWLAVGWLWFCGVLFPVSGIVQIGASRLAERYLYVALPGLVLALTVQVLEWTGAVPEARRVKAQRFLAGVAAALILVMGGFSRHRAGIWQEPTRVWERSARLYPYSSTVMLQYANAAWDARHYQVAGPAYGKVLQLDRRNGAALIGLARMIRSTKDLPRAADVYAQGLAYAPDISQAQVEYAQVLAALGRDTEALGVLRTLCARAPYFPDAWFLMAQCQSRLGDHAAALESMDQGWKYLRAAQI